MDNKEEHNPNRDKLFKSCPFLDRFYQSCKDCYTPTNNLAVDEFMMPWKGHIAFQQYNSSKPINYDSKMYFFCEAGTGYITRLKVYSSKEGDTVQKDHDGNVVCHLLKDFLGEGHTIYTNNFTSIPMVEELKQHDINVAGTLRANRVDPTGSKGEENTKWREGLHKQDAP